MNNNYSHNKITTIRLGRISAVEEARQVGAIQQVSRATTKQTLFIEINELKLSNTAKTMTNHLLVYKFQQWLSQWCNIFTKSKIFVNNFVHVLAELTSFPNKAVSSLQIGSSLHWDQKTLQQTLSGCRHRWRSPIGEKMDNVLWKHFPTILPWFPDATLADDQNLKRCNVIITHFRYLRRNCLALTRGNTTQLTTQPERELWLHARNLARMLDTGRYCRIRAMPIIGGNRYPLENVAIAPLRWLKMF